MRSFYLTGFALLTGCYADAAFQPSCAQSAADPSITQAPPIPAELLRRQNGDRFMGWIQYDGEWTTRNCDIGGTLYQNNDQWRCCATTVDSCNVPVGCISGSLIYSFSTGSISRTTIDCTSIYSDPSDRSFTLCNTGFLFEHSLDSSPRTNLFCGISAVNWSYYRQKPAAAESTSSTEALSTPSSAPRSTPASATSTGSTSSPTAVPPEQPKEESKAWIAGAVVGPVVGLALIGAGLFFFLRRRKNKKTPPPVAPQQAPPYPGSPDQGFQQPYYGQMQQNQAGFVPYGVGVNEQKHQSVYAPPPQSPLSHASNSPIPPNSPFQQPQGQQPQQQWAPQQQQQQPNSPQMLGSEVNYNQQYPQGTSPQGTSPQMSPQTPAAYQEAPKQAYVAPAFSSELEGTPYQQPAATQPPAQETR